MMYLTSRVVPLPTSLAFSSGKELGLYNPQTLDGRIVVNGIIASTYTTAVIPEAAHALLTPLRCLFNVCRLRDLIPGFLEKGQDPW